jgi:hypothetical protein
MQSPSCGGLITSAVCVYEHRLIGRMDRSHTTGGTDARIRTSNMDVEGDRGGHGRERF